MFYILGIGVLHADRIGILNIIGIRASLISVVGVLFMVRMTV